VTHTDTHSGPAHRHTYLSLSISTTQVPLHATMADDMDIDLDIDLTIAPEEYMVQDVGNSLLEANHLLIATAGTSDR
jgi:hypothetical protein